MIPTLGGEERLLVERGFSPRFSPDGHVDRLWSLGIGGQPDLYRARVWRTRLRDRRRLLPGSRPRVVARWRRRCFSGASATATPTGEQRGLVRVTATGGDPIQNDARSVLLREGFEAFHGLPTA